MKSKKKSIDKKIMVQFEYMSNRLSRVEIYHDFFKDIEFYQHISSFELHVFGIVSQFHRIQEVLKEIITFNEERQETNKNNSSQMRLDIYYLILTWDKLKKIFNKLKSQVNIMIQDGRVTKDFIEDFKLTKKRIEHLFREYNDSIRNEYEHPSLKYQRIGNNIMYGGMMIKNESELSVHVGGDVNVTIKKTHVEQIESLRIDLIDLFIKHFTDKKTTKDLLKIRKEFGENIDEYVFLLKKYSKRKYHKKFNELFSSLVGTELFFSTEGLPLSEEVRNKVYGSIL